MQSMKTPFRKDLRSIERLAFCVRWRHSHMQIENGGMDGMCVSHKQPSDGESHWAITRQKFSVKH